MSDVEKAISGEDGDKSKTTTTTNTTTAAAVKQQQLQQQQQYYQSKSTLAIDSTVSTSIGAPSRTQNCLSHLVKIAFSTPGLVLLVVVYSVMGALIFPLLEAPQDVTKSAAIAKSREDCLRELWIITEKLNVLYERNWTMLVHEQLRRFEGSIVAATRHGVGHHNAVASSSTALGRFGGGNMDALEQARWSFSEALLYSVTVITTIGHGSLTPKTAAGKIATILYALIGVPLMLMCLSSLGALLAEALQCTYARICCRLAGSNVVNSSSSGSGRGSDNKQRQRRCSADSLDDEERNDGKVGVVGIHHAKSSEEECLGQSNVMDCKNCKYDAVIGKVNLNNGYDYGGIGGATNEHGEDSCQLLHNNSPAKVNHNSPCMQLKAAAAATATMAVNAQYYQRAAHMQQQQQQQQQQQRPDVMLMTTTQKFPPHSQQQQQQQLQQQCSRSATPSPQHFQHPLQTFHIVSSSPNSSPTHQTLKQYATLQPQHHHHNHHHQQQQHSQQLQLQQHHQQQRQHFVAVPSSMVRFQTALPTSNCTNSEIIGSNVMPPNCYQPAAVAVTGAATIYFPIAATPATVIAAGTSSLSSSAGTITTAPPPPPPTTATASATTSVAGSQLQLCNQPLVKYHTIQLQHKKPFAAVDATSVNMPPLPPPPAYQTATVHGVRRAKFLTKPLPHEINTLLAENELVSCRQHDFTAQISSSNSSSNSNNNSTAATSAATTIATTGTIIPTVATCLGMLSTGATVAATATTMTTSTTAGLNTSTFSGGLGGGGGSSVDIMEDEEENEQQRIGNCPHGTPSRVPLISTGGGGGSNASSSVYGNSKESEKSATRGLINATAASFHRHTLHTFHRGGNRKSTILTQRRISNMQASSSGGKSGNGSGLCYGDTAETSDDEDEAYMQHGSEQFVLNQIEPEEEEDDDDDNEDANDQQHSSSDGPQVPISIVLLILICYICLGTVIFAFWENWSLIDGAYFCFVTLATIGYGDFLPERTFNGPEVQLFACCAYLLLGLVLVAMSFSILETQLMWKCKRIAVRLKLAKD